MLVSELMAGGNHSLLLRSSKIWGLEVSKLTELDLRVFVRRHNDSPAALSEAQALIDAAFNRALTDLKTPPRICHFKMAPERITTDELVSWLAVVSGARRRAILFALETGMSVPDVIELTWKDLAKVRGLSEFALKIAKGMVRHIRLPYVFWETQEENQMACPLFGLVLSAEEVSNGYGFDALRVMYQNIIPVDREQERLNFVDDVVELADK